MKVKLKHTRQQARRKKTQQMNADWPVYQESCTQVMLCYYRTEAKRSIDALKRIKSYQREEEETTEV